jgi:hypothetical protein
VNRLPDGQDRGRGDVGRNIDERTMRTSEPAQPRAQTPNGPLLAGELETGRGDRRRSGADDQFR